MSQNGRLDDNIVFDAGRLLSEIDGMTLKNLPPAMMIARQGPTEAWSAMADEFVDDIGIAAKIFGRKVVQDQIAARLMDAEAAPRTLSLALMAAAVDLPADDLRGAVAGLAGREVMQWDNVRIYPTFVSLGYLGDCALFNTVLTTLTPDTVHAATEGAWDTGRGLPEIVTAIDATQQDVDRVFGTCDRDRLGTLFDTIPQEAFDIYVDNADLFVTDALDFLAATRSSAPDRAYACV